MTVTVLKQAATMNWSKKRHSYPENPQPLMWGTRLVLSLLALLMLAVISSLITLATKAPWWIVIGHMALATGGACFLLVLFLVHVAQPNETRQRQFSMRLALTAMVGLGMMLAGIGGIFRLARFDPSQTTLQDWLGLIFAFASIFLIGTPLLAVLLETGVTLANAVVRLPVMRRLFRRSGRGRRDRASRE